MTAAKEPTYRQYYSLSGLEIDEVIILGNCLSLGLAAASDAAIPGELMHQITNGMMLLREKKINDLMAKLTRIMIAANIDTVGFDVTGI